MRALQERLRRQNDGPHDVEALRDAYRTGQIKFCVVKCTRQDVHVIAQLIEICSSDDQVPFVNSVCLRSAASFEVALATTALAESSRASWATRRGVGASTPTTLQILALDIG